MLTPSFNGRRRPENEKLVCHAGSSLYVVETSAAGLSSACYPLADVCCVENGMILLHSWITVTGVDSLGVVTSSTLKFNSVTDHIMAPFVDCLRAPTTGGNAVDLAAQRARFGFLAPAHSKFRSYGQNSVRPGATVLSIMLQPEIRQELLRLFNYSLSRLVSPNHLTILTDSELILIRDDSTQHWLKGSPHGAICTYIPPGENQSGVPGHRERRPPALGCQHRRKPRNQNWL